MSISRRRFLKLGGATASALSLAACGAIGRELAQNDLPESLAIPAGAASDNRVVRLLNRAGYGPRPGDVEAAQSMGFEAYLDSQLDPQSIDDQASDLLIRNLNVYNMETAQLESIDAREAGADLVGATLIRETFSKRGLYEAMVEFWSDHFNIYLRKNRFMPILKMIDDRDVIRPNALGMFHDLLLASAHSPAMLVYLDNAQSGRRAPNENYARELLELHTVGVNGGYAQSDVQELARALTGWGVGRRDRDVGEFFFDPDRHDFGEKTVMGLTLPAGRGEEEMVEVLEMLAAHPSTAHFIASKLVRRFVADDPPDSLVHTVREVFLNTGGDIKAMLRAIFLSEAFASAPPRLKRPLTYMVSALRALNADIGPRGFRALWEWLGVMGQAPFLWPPPNGYPDVSAAWANNLLPRWNFAIALTTGQITGVEVPFERIIEAGGVQDMESGLRLMGGLVLGGLDDLTLAVLRDYVGTGALDEPEAKQRMAESVALMLASPAFQYM